MVGISMLLGLKRKIELVAVVQRWIKATLQRTETFFRFPVHEVREGENWHGQSPRNDSKKRIRIALLVVYRQAAKMAPARK